MPRIEAIRGDSGEITDVEIAYPLDLSARCWSILRHAASACVMRRRCSTAEHGEVAREDLALRALRPLQFLAFRCTAQDAARTTRLAVLQAEDRRAPTARDLAIHPLRGAQRRRTNRSGPPSARSAVSNVRRHSRHHAVAPESVSGNPLGSGHGDRPGRARLGCRSSVRPRPMSTRSSRRSSRAQDRRRARRARRDLRDHRTSAVCSCGSMSKPPSAR